MVCHASFYIENFWFLRPLSRRRSGSHGPAKRRGWTLKSIISQQGKHSYQHRLNRNLIKWRICCDLSLEGASPMAQSPGRTKPLTPFEAIRSHLKPSL